MNTIIYISPQKNKVITIDGNDLVPSLIDRLNSNISKNVNVLV